MNKFDFCNELVNGFHSEAPQHSRAHIVNLLLQSEYAYMSYDLELHEIAKLLDIKERKLLQISNLVFKKIKLYSIKYDKHLDVQLKHIIQELEYTDID